MVKSMAFMVLGFLIAGIFAGSFAIADNNYGGPMIPYSPGNSPQGPQGNLPPNGSGIYNSGAGPVYMGPGMMAQEQQRVQAQYMMNGDRYQVNRGEFQSGNNITSVQITTTITYTNGTQSNYTVQINTQNQSGRLIRNLNMEREGKYFNVSVEDGLNVTDHFFGNHSQLMVNLSNGTPMNISVFPDQALQNAFQRLRMQEALMNNSSNYSIQLREMVQNHIPGVVYNIEAGKPGRFLGIFKMDMNVSAEVNPENGQIVSIHQPWWAFLVSSYEPPANSGNSTSVNETNTTNTTSSVNSTNITTNTTNQTSAPMIPYTNTTNSS